MLLGNKLTVSGDRGWGKHIVTFQKRRQDLEEREFKKTIDKEEIWEVTMNDGNTMFVVRHWRYGWMLDPFLEE